MRKDIKEIALSAINRIYTEDEWIRSLYQAVGLELDKIDTLLDEIDDSKFFNLLSKRYIEYYENQLGITAVGNEEARKSTIEAKWKAGGVVTLSKLQAIVKSYRNGVINLSFDNGKIHVTFNSPIGRPPDLEIIKNMLEDVKPSHLAIYYTFAFIVWNDWKPTTWGTLHSHTWKRALQTEE